MRPVRTDRYDRLILFVFAFVLLLVTEHDVAVGWDEPIYTENGERIVRWMGTLARGLLRADLSEALDPVAIGISFGLNHEHPPIAKALSGLGWALTRGVMPLPTAHRIGPMLLAAWLVMWIHLALRQAGASRAAAWVGALGLLAMPRLFFHAHIAELDLPAAAMWFLATWAFWRLADRRDPWAWIGPALAFGLALTTKISNILAPLGMGLWVLATSRWRRWDLWARLALMGPIGLAVLITLFPWLWTDTVPKLIEWVRFFTVSHYEIYQYYLGKTYLELPWHFPIVTVLSTVPATLLILAAFGAARALRRQGPARDAAALWGLQALVMILWYVRPSSRAFDSDRLLMPAYVFLAPLAGLGFDAVSAWAVQQIRERLPLRREAVIGVLAVIALAPGAIAAARLHPFELAYYNELVGGIHGAQRLKLETIYWASTYRAVLPELNRRAAPGATVWVMPNSWDVLYYYQRAGLLRPDLVMVRPPGWGSFYDDQGVQWVEASIDEADFAIVEYRQTTFFDYVVDYMQRHEPVWQLDHDGVPLVALYERDR